MLLALTRRAVARRLIAFAVGCVFVLAAGCSPAAPDDRLEIVTAAGARHAFHIELAVKPEQRERGLMYRQSLDADAGMLFDFQTDQTVDMWMKNTYIPLDMVFIARDGTIVRIAADTVPLSLDIVSSGGPVRAVLELKGGETARRGIGPGAKVVHPLFANGK